MHFDILFLICVLNSKCQMFMWSVSSSESRMLAEHDVLNMVNHFELEAHCPRNCQNFK